MESPNLEADARTVVEEEEAMLARVFQSIEKARQKTARAARGGTSTAALRALREQALEASAEDLPDLLHEMAVRQRLRERPPAKPLPNPAAPYVAHLRVDEGKGADDYLLGHVTFFASEDGVHIVDWRIAPVARIFYRYREGDRYEEEFPGRLAEGSVVARRIVVIEEGRLTRIIDDRHVLERDPAGDWVARDRHALSLASGGAGTAARPGILGVGVGAAGAHARPEITALLDAEQYAAVSAPPERPLLVLGNAGSGKTTVALHRLARVSAAEPSRYPLAKSNVVVPEQGLARLSRRLLEPLGVGPGRVTTAEAWMTALARRVFGRRIRVFLDAPPLVSGLKRHPALYHALGQRFASARPGAKLQRLRRMLAEAFTDRGFLDGVVAASDGELPLTAIDETLRHTMLQLEESPARELRSISDPERKRAIDGRAIAEGTPDEVAGTLDVEDLPILLWLRARAGALDGGEVSLLVLDEAEDFSLFELFTLGRELGETSSVTVAGDEAQQTSSSFAGWETSLRTLGVSGPATIRLPTSYRCPRPVAELARRVLGPLAREGPVLTARDGAPVGVFRMPSESQAHLFLAGALRDLVDREPRACVGVIAGAPDAARRFHALLADVPEARVVVDGEFTFEAGIDVTDVDQVKGLEFDYVVIPDATAAAYPATSEARRKLHVAITRTSHQLWIVAGGPASPLLPLDEPPGGVRPHRA